GACSPRRFSAARNRSMPPRRCSDSPQTNWRSDSANASSRPPSLRRPNLDAGPHRPAKAAVTARGSPTAAYRAQLRREFTFDDTAAIVPYLDRLGVDTLYCSPFLQARPESTHGYDVSDHNTINPALGGRDGFERLSQALRRHGMRLLVDVVPNHMG